MNNYESFKKRRVKVRWSVVEVYKITQYKAGCVYKTRSLGIISCSPEYREILRQKKDIQVGSVSTKISKLIMG